ncbi:glutathione S-transferase omega-1-like [Branchiostoma floridae]|uniref:Glutathione S-transferase omega n=1 Tax=Branchiostoma floridae TaxID=7739 RepID=A0A9J7MT39_BRAFL|nr:glutathione S-transferase omega-1-like [Branchiostoma floridae]
MPTQKAYKTGSTAPEPPAPGVVRLISMRFCPFAHRTRLVLAAKGIEYETVNVCTKNKPEWFFSINPLAKVPTLQHDGKVVYESLVCNEYVDRVFPGRKLLPEEPLEKARIGMLQAIWDAKRNGKTPSRPLRNEGLSFLEKDLATGDRPFFGGEQPGLLDYSIWPFFERFETTLHGDLKLPQAEFPKVLGWKAAMFDRPEVKTCGFDTATYTSVAANYDPDFGLAA